MVKNVKQEITWSECTEKWPAEGTVVSTACGGITSYSKETPCLTVNGEQVFFCIPLCKQDFISDPRFSCLANKLDMLNK